MRAPTTFRNIHLRQNDRVDQKERIARAAADMIHDDDRIMIEAGTTCALIVKYLTGKRGVQVLTNSVLVFANARSNPNLNITLTGGTSAPSPSPSWVRSQSAPSMTSTHASPSWNRRVQR